jgi:hypothetical protein
MCRKGIGAHKITKQLRAGWRRPSTIPDPGAVSRLLVRNGDLAREGGSGALSSERSGSTFSQSLLVPCPYHGNVGRLVTHGHICSSKQNKPRAYAVVDLQKVKKTAQIFHQHLKSPDYTWKCRFLYTFSENTGKSDRIECIFSQAQTTCVCVPPVFHSAYNAFLFPSDPCRQLAFITHWPVNI